MIEFMYINQEAGGYPKVWKIRFLHRAPSHIFTSAKLTRGVGVENCKVCNQELTQPTKGRSRTYCNTTCRRMAEFEVRRINRRLERLEDRLLNEQEPNQLIQPDEKKITFLEDAIRRQKQQLFDLIKED